MKHLGWIILLVLVISIAGWIKFERFKPTMTCLYSDATKKIETICVNDIKADSLVKSPLALSGRARGNWFFEASFPVELLDGTKKVIAQVPAHAEGDWMTEDLVPFTAQLTFTDPATATGKLVLKKDNPSGLPQNDASLSIPIRFR